MGVALVLIAYGALIFLGGLIGYSRTNSKVSLIVGGVAGAILLLCGALAWRGIAAGAYIGLAMTLLLTLLFLRRYGKTKKMRPAGVMLALSAVAAVGEVILLLV